MVANSTEEALLKLLEPGRFLYQSIPADVERAFRALGHPELELQPLQVESVQLSSIMLANQSPFKRIFNKGVFKSQIYTVCVMPENAFLA